jgi:hypothetical protein
MPLFATIRAAAAYKGNMPTFANIPAWFVLCWQQDKAGKRKKAAGPSPPPMPGLFALYHSFTIQYCNFC